MTDSNQAGYSAVHVKIPAWILTVFYYKKAMNVKESVLGCKYLIFYASF